MSEQQELDETRYEADARRWLRVYPPRWRRAREDEVLGVILDLRPSGAGRLTARTRLDLVRGSLGFRWRTRPPLLVWLLWRFGDVTPSPAYRDWLLDHSEGRLSGFRAQWLSTGGVFAVVMAVVLHAQSPPSGRWVAALPLLACLAMSLMPHRWWARRLRRELLKEERQAGLSRSFDAAVPWRARTRWAWGPRVLLPVAGLAGGSVAGLAVALTGPGLPVWWPGSTPTWEVVAGDGDAPVIWLGLGLIGCGPYLVQLLGSAMMCRRRVLTRPDQPWRAPVVPLPWWLVVPLTVLAALAPLGLVLPWSATASSTMAVLSVFALAPVLALAVVVVVSWVRVARVLSTAPGPPLAVVDVLSTRGGDRVPVDAPTPLLPWSPPPPFPPPNRSRRPVGPHPLTGPARGGGTGPALGGTCPSPGHH